MQNRQKFHLSQFVRLKGQPKSPAMTITKVFRTIEENEGERTITFAYQCSWWNVKLYHFSTFNLEESTLEKVRHKKLHTPQE
jgi:uncharacterized protein YodC (DUF2158 family)